MPSQKRIGEDQYTRPEYTEQDIISSDIDSIKEKLNNFVRVYPDFYKDIPCSTWIKYVTFEGLYRSGGILIANKSPKYLVLKNPIKKITWSVNLEKNYIYIENIKEKKELTLRKDNLYKLWEAGFIEILDTPKKSEE